MDSAKGAIGAGFGGAVFNFGNLTLTNSTLMENIAAGGNGDDVSQLTTQPFYGQGTGGGNLGGGNAVSGAPIGLDGSNGAFGNGGQGGGGSTRTQDGLEGSGSAAGDSGGNGGFGGGGGGGASGRGFRSFDLAPGNSTGGRGGFGGGDGSQSLNIFGINSSSQGSAGGGMGAGGAIFQFSGSLSIVNSTLSRNQVINGRGVDDPDNITHSASQDGAALGSVLFVYGGTTSINHSSIVDNNPTDTAPPIYVFASSPTSLTIQSSLISDESACAGTVPVDVGGNLASSGCSLIVASPITGLARDLADNGGPSPTFALAVDSNAVDQVTIDTLQDQRGLTRPQGNASDSGAYEVEQALTVSLSNNQVNEQDGTAVLTVSRFGSLNPMTSVTISSSSAGNASVTTSVLSLGANQTAASTLISIVDNDLIDGLRTVTFTASAAGFSNGVASLNISDNDLDGDGDSIANQVDNCPAIANTDQANLDGDNQGDACDSDIDGDTIANDADNCPLIVNTNQNNFDGDSQGDACDSDDDNDDYETANGLNPLDPSDASADADNDGFSNIEEFEAGSDPQVADTDNNNNGVPDSVETNARVITPTLLLLLFDEE